MGSSACCNSRATTSDGQRGPLPPPRLIMVQPVHTSVWRTANGRTLLYGRTMDASMLVLHAPLYSGEPLVNVRSEKAIHHEALECWGGGHSRQIRVKIPKKYENYTEIWTQITMPKRLSPQRGYKSLPTWLHIDEAEVAHAPQPLRASGRRKARGPEGTQGDNEVRAGEGPGGTTQTEGSAGETICTGEKGRGRTSHEIPRIDNGVSTRKNTVIGKNARLSTSSLSFIYRRFAFHRSYLPSHQLL